MRIVFLGDSLTEAVDETSYLRALGRLVAGDAGFAGCELINAGVGGDTVGHLVRRVSRDVAPHAPDWVVVLVGVNDLRTWYARRTWPTAETLRFWWYFARYKGIWRAITPIRYAAGLGALVDHLRSRTAARIALCTPVTASEWMNARAERMLDRYVDAVRIIATERNLPLIDLHAAFASAVQQHRTGHPGGDYHFTSDGVHLSAVGAELAAQTTYSWLRSVG